MHYTIFNTPILKTILFGIAMFFLKILGWKKVGSLPDTSKYVIVIAPHTSNWDVFYGVILTFAFKLDVYFMAKKELFQWPFGPIVKLLGGMPIDRSASGNTVDHVIRKYAEHERLVIAIAPEGTRSKEKYWKTGFYHIAAGARVPILLGYLDYATKTGGAGPLIMPSGVIEKDMQTIGKFYGTVTGKYADKTGPVSIPKTI